MKRVVLRVGDDGAVWVTAECRGCGHVYDGRAAQAVIAPVVCGTCHRTMDIRGAIIEAAERGPKSPDTVVIDGWRTRGGGKPSRISSQRLGLLVVAALWSWRYAGGSVRSEAVDELQDLGQVNALRVCDPRAVAVGHVGIHAENYVRAPEEV